MLGAITIMAAALGLSPAVLAASSALGTAYIVCLGVGGGLLIISTIFGHHAEADVDVPADADFGLDVDADVEMDADVAGDVDVAGHVDAAGDVHAADAHEVPGGVSLASWFSIRFLVYFMAGFGLFGTVLTYTTSVGMWPVLGISVLAGLVIGQGIHQTIRYIQRTSGDSAATVRDFVNQSARVTLAIAPGQTGEIALQVRGYERFVPAVAKRRDDCFSTGDRVAVVTYANGLAEVISKEEYDFVHENEKGVDA
jgi:hypothetical protein